ncbi:hypothetical protein BUALT_Bualt19G0018000 [Buddleja alternifolia]|uniref:Flavin-containing monooxygenase n=1 Tax=Buddleja alternifolia TaxID=168488 RepID=A0AAV6W1D8_9LAMI|nr:hypothetical protein BUALT_Bualt19G0018000 [Buddleja alternifolia]
MAPPLRVAVIGAGVSGLATARALKKEGQQVVVYEKLNQLGGLWVYEPQVESDPLSLDPNREIVHGSMYQSLRTNLPRQLMGFSDYPFAIRERVDLRTFPSHEEMLEFLKEFAREFGLAELIRFETEVVRVEQMDSRNHKWIVESRKNDSSSNSKSKEIFDAVVIVVVIGDGTSGKDISLEISKVAKEVHLSSRSSNIKICKLDCGDNMWQHSKRFKYDFPFLNTEGFVTVDDNRVEPLYKHIFPPELAPSLSFVGITFQGLIILMMDLQAKWVARVLSGKASLPSKEDMLAEVQHHYQYMEDNGIPKHYTHGLGYKKVVVTAHLLDSLDAQPQLTAAADFGPLVE